MDRILTVVDRTSSEPIVYANLCDVSMETEVRAAAAQVALELPKDLGPIMAGLSDAGFWNLDDRFAFDVIEVG